MGKMMELHVQLLFMLTALAIHGTHGQVTPPSNTTVLLGADVTLTCTSTETNPTFTWIYVPEAQTLFFGDARGTTIPRYDNIVLQEGTGPQTSILNINAIELEDDGEYQCTITTVATNPPSTIVTVEVASQSQPINLISIDNFAIYQATCDAIGSKPEETITWVLDGVVQTDGFVETDPGISSDPLFDLSSVFTFPATLENYNVTLTCQIGGHLLDSLNREESRRVDVQNPPAFDGVKVGFKSNSGRTQLTITCDTNDAVQAAIPAMSNFYIYDSNDTLTHMSTNSINSVTVDEPEEVTEYKCIGGNYLGNTSEATNTYDPTSTTTPIPTTEPIATEGPTGTSGPEPLSAGAIAGIAIAALLVIIIIVVLIIVFVLKPDCVSGLGSSSGGGGGPKKHGSSSVGSSNGNDKDNFKPTPQPRQSSIKHTNENPGMAEYAMVDRKPKASSGGDMPDTRGNGAGQNEQPGMHYADLDLTPGAGHTEEKVPQNPDNVVVYSSILV